MLYGRLTTILSWYDALPTDMLKSRLRLRFYKAWALAMAGQPKVADKILLDVRSSFEAMPNSPEYLALRGELATLRTGIIIHRNDPDEMVVFILEQTSSISYWTLLLGFWTLFLNTKCFGRHFHTIMAPFL